MTRGIGPKGQESSRVVKEVAKGPEFSFHHEICNIDSGQGVSDVQLKHPEYSLEMECGQCVDIILINS